MAVVRSLALAIALLSAWMALPMSAPAATCTDGTDCFCDCIESAGTPGTYKNAACQAKGIPIRGDEVICEDFENPLYASQDGALAGTAWDGVWGTGAGGQCQNAGANSCHFYITETGQTCDTVGGDTGCVLDGDQSLGNKYYDTMNGGAVGSRSFSDLTSFSLSVRMRWSPNFTHHKDGNSCNPGEGPTGLKTIFLTDTDSGSNNKSLLMGAGQGNTNSSNAAKKTCPTLGTSASSPTESPFGANIHKEFCCAASFGCSGVQEEHCNLGGVTQTEGIMCESDYHYVFTPTTADYDWGVTHTVGEDHLVQVSWENLLSNPARFRLWIDGDLMVDASGIDGTKIFGGSGAGANGIDYLQLDNYFNDCWGGGTGSERAYRVEDNVLLTSSATPPTPAELGFGAAAVCGDGVIEGGEACDDSNTSGSDGCAADCSAIESGWGCTGEPSVCTQIPVAAFSCSPTSDTTTTTVAVTCTDASTNSPTSWAWDLANNGSTDSTSQNPTFNLAPGVYTIRLRATNAGGYDDETKTNYVSITQSSPGSKTSIPSYPRVRLR